MQHFSIPCRFGTETSQFPLYVGEPAADCHPLEQQAAWLARERGGSVAQEVMDSFDKLLRIALENHVSFEELCVYAMNEAVDNQATDTGDGSQSPTPEPE